MRILTVRFRNLNSLQGEWSIDFTNPHYTSSGIFAIIGATGAGKTTILDAISLALYGRTPRLKQLSKSTNEVMSRQTGDCFAEVEFQSAKGNFRVHWSQRRARKNPAGELQPPKHEFVDAITHQVIATKIKDVGQQVLDCTGMTFDQFTRSMLLAQGDFSKFLQANSDQRAPILEQITGTEIYSELSKQVHVCKAEEEKKLELLENELKNVAIPTVDELAAMQGEQKKLTTASVLLQNKIVTITKQLQWQENILSLKKRKSELQIRLTAHKNAWESKAKERALLKDAEQSHLLKDIYKHLTVLRRDQISDTEQRTVAEKAIKESRKQLEHLRQQTTKADLDYQSAVKEQQATVEIISIVRQLDYEIHKIEKEQSDLSKELKAVEQNLGQTTKDLLGYERDISNCKDTIQKIRTYQTENHQDESLLENFSGIEAKATQLQQITEGLRKLKQKQKTLHKALAEKARLENNKTRALATLHEQDSCLLKKIQTQEETLQTLAPKGVTTLYTQLQALRTTVTTLTEVQQLNELHNQQQSAQGDEEKQQKCLYIDLEKQQNELKQTRELIASQQENVAKQEELVLLTNKIANYESERTKLEENCPCPLCGSKDHPYHTSTPPAKDDAELKLAKEKKNLQQLETKQQKGEIEQNRLQLTLEASEARSRDLTESIAKVKKALQDKSVGINSEATVSEEIEKKEEDIVLTETLIRKTDTEQQTLQKFEEQQKQLAQTLQSEMEEFRNIQKRKNSLDTKLDIHSKIVEQTNEDRLRLLAILTELLGPFAPAPEKIEDIPPIVENLRQRQQQWKISISSLTKQEQLLQKNNSVKETTAHTKKTYEKEASRLQLRLKILSDEQHSLREKRIELFGDKDPDREEQTQKTILETKTKRCKELLEQVQKGEKQHATLNAQMQQLQTSISKRTMTLLQEEDSFAKKYEDAGFSSEKLFLQARLEDSLRNRLKLQLETLAKNVEETEVTLRDLDETITQEQAKEITDQDHTFLVSEQQKQTAELGDIQQQLGALSEKIDSCKKNMSSHQEKQVLIENQRIEFTHWAQLHSLIGSADGKKFRNFAQGLTFEIMVNHANQTLEKMSDRYLLRRCPEAPLELTVIDAYQAGEIRSTANLSGGETFIISLALALGLSTMAGKNVQIDSLFLDEGFGTLDEESLEIALSTLATLQQRGKIIGIISHVPLLRERIDVQLHLHHGADGRSTISGPGVTGPVS